MDKVRVFMNIAWVQRFWILSVVGVLAALICWNMASAKLQAEFAANKTAIDGQFSNMSAIAGKSVHGNTGVNAKEREEAKKIAGSVKELWQNLYNAQRDEVLYWPKELGTNFLKEIEKKKFGAPITIKSREFYLNYIKTRFDALVAIVTAKKMLVEGSALGGMEGGRLPEGMMGGATAMLGPDGLPIEENYLVQWVDQANLKQRLEFPGVPTAGQIWVTQEDLWVYETLLGVIRDTNKERGATRPDNTAVRVIQSLEVGQPAAAAMAVESQILMSADVAMAGGEAMPPEMGMGGGEAGMMVEGADPDAMLLAGRYIDGEGKPIQDGSGGLGVEFRRLPIRMVLMMDERWIPKVLVECANAPLPIEVKRLRINAEKSGIDKDNQPFTIASAAVGGMAEGGRGMGGGMGMMGRPSMPMGGMRGMEGGGMGMTLSPADTANLATVEIQGIAYIYTPPDPAVLAVPGGDDQTLAAGDPSVVR